MGQNGQFSSRGKYNSARQTDFQCPKLPSVDLDEQNVSNDVCEGRQLSPVSPPNIEGDMPPSFSKYAFISFFLIFTYVNLCTEYTRHPKL